MFWKRGWILNTLKYRVERELRETIYENECFKKYEWSTIEKFINWSSKHIGKINFALISFFVIFTILFSQAYSNLKNLLPQSVNGLSGISDFTAEILSAQITFIALIFPIVIALIGILIQSRSSNQAIWHIYKHNSGFMLVGFSALNLVISFVAIKLLSPWLNYEQTIAVNIYFSLWFVLNLLISGWFLSKTVGFLTISSRNNIIFKFLINEIHLSFIRHRLSGYIFKNIIENELNKGVSENLVTNVLSTNKYDNKIIAYKISPHTIDNVYLRLLSLGVLSFSNRYKELLNEEKGHLSIPSNIHGHYSNELILAETDLGRFDDISNLIIRFSFRLSKKIQKTDLNHEQTVAVMFSQIEDALKDNNSIIFKTSLEDLKLSHRDINSCFYYIDHNGQPNSWMFLASSDYFDFNYIQVFIRHSISVSKAVTNKIIDDQSYYNDWCYFFPGLMTRSKDERLVIAESYYISGHYYLWETLMSWMNGYRGSDIKYDQTQDSAIKRFISSWEHWQYLVTLGDEYATSVNYETKFKHLTATSKMIICALKFNNLEATEWAIDTLNNWGETFVKRDRNYDFRWHTGLVTKQVIGFGVNDHIYNAIFKNADSEPLSQDEVYSILLINNWIDIRCLTAAYILGSDFFSDTSETNIYELINMLVKSTRLENFGFNSLMRGSIETPIDLMGVFLRMHMPWETNFSSGCERHLEELSSIQEPEWVSGRIYSSRGDTRETFIPSFFKVFGISITDQPFTIDFNWMDFLKSEAISHPQLEQVIKVLEKLTQFDEKTISKSAEIAGVQYETAQEKASVFKASIENIIRELQSQVTLHLLNTVIDDDLLKSMARASSTSPFDIENGKLPISLFKESNLIEEHQFDPRIIKIDKFPKSRIAKGVDSGNSWIDDSWLKDLVESNVVYSIFKQMLNKLTWTDRNFETESLMIESALNDASKIRSSGSSPIMFIGSPKLVNKIHGSIWGYIKENDKLPFEFRVETGRGNSYLAHIGDIELHNTPSIGNNFCVLTTKESFQKLSIRDYGENEYVHIRYVPEPLRSDDLIGCLNIEFEIDCEFDSSTCYKYNFINSNNI